MEIVSYTTKWEVLKLIDILKKNRVTGEEKNLHLVMFGEAKANAKLGYGQFDTFLLAYCRFWGLKH